MSRGLFPNQRSAKEYWEEEAVSSDDPLKVSRTLPADTPRFIINIFNEFEANVARFCFEGSFGLVLDAGCGTGEILIQALRVCPELTVNYVGLDFSENMLKIAYERAKVESNVSFFQGSATSLPFKDNTFDRIVSSGVIPYLASLQEVVVLTKECYRILKPGGVLIIDAFSMFSPSILVTSFLRLSNIPPPRYISPFWFIRELKNTGFDIISYRGFNFTLFTGYRYLLMGKYKIFDPYFVQERWSRFIENKMVPRLNKISFLGHRIYVKCRKVRG